MSATSLGAQGCRNTFSNLLHFIFTVNVTISILQQEQIAIGYEISVDKLIISFLHVCIVSDYTVIILYCGIIVPTNWQHGYDFQ
jgi:hypothetical protein